MKPSQSKRVTGVHYLLALVLIMIAVVTACNPIIVLPPDPSTTTSSSTSSTTTAPPIVPSGQGMNVLVMLTDDQGCDQHATAARPNPVRCDTVDAYMKFLASEPGGSWWNSTQTRYQGVLCCPDRTSILTGQTIAHTGQYGNGVCVAEKAGELPEPWRTAGYATGYFGKYKNCYPGSSCAKPIPSGWERWVVDRAAPSGYNFDYCDQDTGPFTVAQNGNSTWSSYWYGDRAIEWINQQQAAGRPWFTFYAPYAPHLGASGPTDIGGWTTPANLPNYREGNCKGALNTDDSDKPSFIRDNTCAGSRNAEEAVKGQVGLDNEFKKLYNNLAATGQLNNTIILFMGDNGMGLGSHKVSKKQCAYEECLTNPLMLRLPGSSGGTLNRMISNVDVYPTLLELTGLTTALPADGRSFVQLMRGDTTGWRTDQYSQNGVPSSASADDFDLVRDDCAVRTPCYKYTQYRGGERELYNLTDDPYELVNLLPNPVTGYAGQPGWDDNNPVVVELKARLAAHLSAGA
ncbi:sulfatase-like hydrolase/transferase [Candidatus Saccharibacteria bacterium]|nr:sulfatase-like hydrolase/transferase [Candidatus Saccharibacteria bacterium]